ncbi:MAG TPA: hypothetical protein VK879_21670 [Candidatus Sulfomarinibacteraceae bacterium]|nr:hypothetical protein [Candidatus Sulfomarinibacteraceae bacterium]
MEAQQHPAERWRKAAREHSGPSEEQTRLRLAAMAGQMARDTVASRRAALVDLLADGGAHTREEIWQAIDAQLGRDSWGRRPDETLWRDLRALREGGIRIAYSRRSGVEGYYLQHPPLDMPASKWQEAIDWEHVARIRAMSVPEKNRQAFAAAEFALRQKRLLLAREHPDWEEAQVDAAARRLVFGDHGL